MSKELTTGASFSETSLAPDEISSDALEQIVGGEQRVFGVNNHGARVVGDLSTMKGLADAGAVQRGAGLWPVSMMPR